MKKHIKGGDRLQVNVSNTVVTINMTNIKRMRGFYVTTDADGYFDFPAYQYGDTILEYGNEFVLDCETYKFIESEKEYEKLNIIFEPKQIKENKEIKDLTLNDINNITDAISKTIDETLSNYKEIHNGIKMVINHNIYSRVGNIIWDCSLEGLKSGSVILFELLIIKDYKLIFIFTGGKTLTSVSPDRITGYADIIYDMNKSVESILNEYLSK